MQTKHTYQSDFETLKLAFARTHSVFHNTEPKLERTNRESWYDEYMILHWAVWGVANFNFDPGRTVGNNGRQPKVNTRNGTRVSAKRNGKASSGVDFHRRTNWWRTVGGIWSSNTLRFALTRTHTHTHFFRSNVGEYIVTPLQDDLPIWVCFRVNRFWR